MDKKKFEKNLVKDFFKALGQETNLSDGNDINEPDCFAELDNQKVGIEVTLLYPDDGGQKGGSQLMAQAKRDVRNNVQQGYFINADSYPALSHRIEEKIRKANNYTLAQGSLWLLIVSDVLLTDKKDGKIYTGMAVANCTSDTFLNESTAHELCSQYSNLLKASKYDRVYWHLNSKKILFCWSKEDGGWSSINTDIEQSNLAEAQ